MAELPALLAQDFPAFFEAIHGYSPFPWQIRLAKRLADGSGWPEVLDLPTGSGKTAAIDVAIFQLAIEAGQASRRSPLRIVYVVDRRTIVDQAYERASAITVAIEKAKDGVLAVVRDRLASYGRDGVPLRTAVLRGAIARSDSWARSPDQPLVAVSTVDQVGSRLLFRGYGVSDSMKPVHAGLLGNDVLYLLDEVHLSEPFRETLAAISERYARWAERTLGNPFVVVAMSATPGRQRADGFQLAREDEEHPTLALRLSASKRTTLVSSAGRAFLSEVAKQVEPLLTRPGATIAVVVNRVASARDLHALLRSKLKDASVHLVTGRMRPLDREQLERELFPLLRAGRVRDATQRPTVVVATQCIEAGADFDFDGLVTECASLDALRQRFGRLDRFGQLRGEARGVVVARTDTLKDDPVYGEALGRTWEWLEERSADGDGSIDFGIRGLSVPLDARERGLLAPMAHAPILLPSHLDSWVQTSPRPTPDPDVALWLHGPERGVADVQLVWRADLDSDSLRRFDETSDTSLRERLLGVVESLPPASGEAMSVPFLAVRRWLDGRSEPATADVEGVREPASDDDWKQPREREELRAIAWRGEMSAVVTAKEIRPGDTIVVPASYGGVAFGTWSPGEATPVRDVAERAILRQRGRAMLRLHPSVVRDLFGQEAVSVAMPSGLDAEEVDDRATVREWLESVNASSLDSDATRLVESLRRDTGKKALRIERLPLLEGDGEYFLLSARRRVATDLFEVSSEDDRASFTGIRIPLRAHLAGVRDVAGDFAARVGVPSDLVTDIRLAGRWHDVGKVDPRFQRLLHGGSEFKALVQSEPIAKSAAPMNDRRARQRALARSGYPIGARHELMSLALMASAADELSKLCGDLELVEFLVASHHGRCRPFAPWVADDDPVAMSWELDGVTTAGSSDHGLARLDSGVAERFWRLVRRYGWWGLAWLETVLRLGDHRRSEDEQQDGGGAA